LRLGGVSLNDISSKYENQGNLGSGNFGSVYKGYNKIIERVEAVKVIENIHKLGNKANIEAMVQHKLKHDNVTEIYDAFIRNDKLYILMEYLKGGSVFNLLQKQEKLSVKQAIKITIDALHGLQFIHNNNFIHRDIKPSNILLDKSGVAKLSDFGLTSELDKDGKFKSRYGYTFHKGPEVFTLGEFRRESDIFALGLTLYRMVNGDKFISNYENTEIPYKIVSGEFPPRDQYSPDVPKKLISVINKSLELKPENRYTNAHSMRSEIGRIGIPIDWELNMNSNRKQIWVGQQGELKHHIEVTKNIFSSFYDISYKKGHNQLRQVSKYCYNKLKEKDMTKRLHKLLTENL
jgi:serine/threonine-protein kinase